MFHHRAEDTVGGRKRDRGRLERWWFKQQKPLRFCQCHFTNTAFHHTRCVLLPLLFLPPPLSLFSPFNADLITDVSSFAPPRTLPPGFIWVQYSGSPKTALFAGQHGAASVASASRAPFFPALYLPSKEHYQPDSYKKRGRNQTEWLIWKVLLHIRKKKNFVFFPLAVRNGLQTLCKASAWVWEFKLGKTAWLKHHERMFDCNHDTLFLLFVHFTLEIANVIIIPLIRWMEFRIAARRISTWLSVLLGNCLLNVALGWFNAPRTCFFPFIAKNPISLS